MMLTLRPFLPLLVTMAILVSVVGVLVSVGGAILYQEDPRLTEVKLEQQIKDATFYAAGKRVLYVVSSVVFSASVLALSFGAYHRISVHTFTLGEHREIKVRWRDMSRMGFVVEGLVLAEQMKEQHQGFKELVDTLQSQIVRGLLTPNGSTMIDVTPEPQKALPLPVPTFREMSPGMGDLIIGMDDQGDMLSLPVEKCYSMAFGGQSGSGKTSTLRNLIAQLLLIGEIDIWIIDPHVGNDESLVTSIGQLKDLPNVHTCDRLGIKEMVNSILRMIDGATRTGQKMERLQLVVIDEVKKLVEMMPEVKNLIEQIGMETRKFNIFGLFSTQSWPAKMFNGSEVRDNLVTIFSHRTKKRQALTLFDDNDIAKKVQNLKTGQLLVTGNYFDEERIVTVPYCSLADANEVFLEVNGRCNVAPVAASVAASVAPAVAPDDARKVEVLHRAREYFKNPEYSLSEFADQHGINKGTLWKMLNGKLRMNETVYEILAQALRPANVIDFPKK